MTEARARQLREVLSNAMQLVSDEIALENPFMYPEWEPDKVYDTIGFRVRDNGVLYSVLQSHTSQVGWEPSVAPSLFAQVIYDEGQILPWVQPDSTNAYPKGAKVTHNDKTWESDYDNNVWEPGVFGWHEVIE